MDNARKIGALILTELKFLLLDFDSRTKESIGLKQYKAPER